MGAEVSMYTRFRTMRATFGAQVPRSVRFCRMKLVRPCGVIPAQMYLIHLYNRAKFKLEVAANVPSAVDDALGGGSNFLVGL